MWDISAEAAAPTDGFLSFRTAEVGGKGRADAPQPGGLPAMELRVSTIGRRLRPPVFCAGDYRSNKRTPTKRSHVRGPTMPSAAKPNSLWNAVTAFSVAEP